MTRREQLKERIKRDLLAKKTSITSTYHDVCDLFYEILDENPAIKASVGDAIFSMAEKGGTFKIKYSIGKAVKTDGRHLGVDNKEEFECLMYQAITNFRDNLRMEVPLRFNIDKMLDDYWNLYQSFHSNLMKVSYKSQTGMMKQKVEFTFKYRIGKVQLITMERELCEKLEELNEKLYTSDMRPETKALIAHNYLIENVEYWKKDEPNPLERSYMQSAYGAIVNGKCVCQGYAEAYKRMLNAQDIECEVIRGKIKGHTSGHAWNMVSFDGETFYHVDVTWDDGRDRYKYYGLKDSDLSADRQWTINVKMRCNGAKDILRIAKGQIYANKDRYIASGIDKKYLGL